MKDDRPPMSDQTQDPVLQEARQWFVLLREPGASEAERSAFADWLHRGPAERAAWERVERLWARLDPVVPALRGQTAERRQSGPWRSTRSQPAGGRRAAASAGNMGRRFWLKGAVAASLVSVVAGGRLMRTTGLFADETSGIGERRSLALADGSRVELGSATALSIEFDDTARRVVLHSGEAFFHVSADPERPFVVSAGRGATRALGTAFDVKLLEETVQVSVVEHSVAVALSDGAGVALDEGEQVRYGADGLGPVVTADPAIVEAWRHDRLLFRETPLHEVVADLERYRHGRIVITDAGIGRIPVSGLFHASETDAALETIAATLPVSLTRVTDLLVLIRPR